jgi:hypothetical protein
MPSLDKMITKKNKQGIAHLEIIIAFMLFASFFYVILYKASK